jgi:hypothetical protein
MIHFAPADFVSLDTFDLGWRFTPARAGDLSPATLARIRPLTAARAAGFAQFARDACEDAAQLGATFRSDNPPGAVREQLAALPPVPSTQIVLSWNARTAAVSDWEIFLAQWDDFCYPSSDDVTIWPFDSTWTLCYRHYEIFQFRALSPQVNLGVRRRTS